METMLRLYQSQNYIKIKTIHNHFEHAWRPFTNHVKINTVHNYHSTCMESMSKSRHSQNSIVEAMVDLLQVFQKFAEVLTLI